MSSPATSTSAHNASTSASARTGRSTQNNESASEGFVLQIGRQGAGVDDEAALEFDQPRHRVLLDHRYARQVGLEDPDVEQPVDDLGLVGHRRLHDAERLGELLGGDVRRLRPVGEEVSRAITVVLDLVLAAILYAPVNAYANDLHWTSVHPIEWVAHVMLNAIALSVILHVAIGRRWPFGRHERSAVGRS
jgi:hypothetical protein